MTPEPGPETHPPGRHPGRWPLLAGLLAAALLVSVAVLALLGGQRGLVIALGLLITLAVTGLYVLFVRAGG